MRVHVASPRPAPPPAFTCDADGGARSRADQRALGHIVDRVERELHLERVGPQQRGRAQQLCDGDIVLAGQCGRGGGGWGL